MADGKSGNQKSNVLSNDVCDLLISLRMKSQVDKLLRAAKEKYPDSKDIKLSGNTKEIVEENLRRAVAKDLIPIQDVWGAITEFEESKPHHRLYYTIDDESALSILNDPKAVRQKFFDTQVQPANFPDLKAEPIGEQWADFRELPSGWIAKLYRGGNRWVLNKEESKEEDDRRVRVWTKEYARDVWCIAWDAHRKLLILQFPPHDTKIDYTDSYSGIRAIAGKLVPLSTLGPLQITKSVISLLNSYTTIKEKVRIVLADLGSKKGGRGMFATHTEYEHMLDDNDLAAAVKLFSEANEATIIWLKTAATDSIAEDTRTIVGKKGVNHVQFSAVSTSKALKYICDELIQRSITPTGS
jgi:hypothetical protein